MSESTNGARSATDYCLLSTVYSLKLVSDEFDLDPHPLQSDLRVLAVAADLGDAVVGDARAGDEHLLDRLLLTDAAQVAVAAEDAQPVDDLALLERVVVDEADGRVLEPQVVAHLAQQQLARVARAVDEHAPAAARGRRDQLPEEAE